MIIIIFQTFGEITVHSKLNPTVLSLYEINLEPPYYLITEFFSLINHLREKKSKYFYEYGVKCDYSKAMTYYLKAVDQGNIDALKLINIGMFYENGYGVDKNYFKSYGILFKISR